MQLTAEPIVEVRLPLDAPAAAWIRAAYSNDENGNVRTSTDDAGHKVAVAGIIENEARGPAKQSPRPLASQIHMRHSTGDTSQTGSARASRSPSSETPYQTKSHAMAHTTRALQLCGFFRGAVLDAAAREGYDLVYTHT